MKQHKNRHISYLAIILVVLALGLFYRAVMGYLLPKKFVLNSSESIVNRRYTSQFLKISFLLPEGIIINEKATTLIMTKNGRSISLSRVGSNFGVLDDYVNDLSVKNRFQISEKNNLDKENYQMMQGFIDTEKIYFISPIDSFSVYTLSTSSPELYDELDQIAQSFQYLD